MVPMLPLVFCWEYLCAHGTLAGVNGISCFSDTKVSMHDMVHAEAQRGDRDLRAGAC